MKNFAAILIFLFFALDAAGQAYSTVTTYDEDSGLSQRLVKGIVQDNDGYIWIGTWNGLNRFDGKEFVTLRPDYNDEAFRYSNRISDLHLSPRGNLLCRIDDRISLFDVHSFRFVDLHSMIENETGETFVLKQNLPTAGDEIVLATKDGRYILIPDEADVTGTRILDSLPAVKYRPRSTKQTGDVGPYRVQDLAMSRVDSTGTIWLITRNGEIISSPGASGPFTVHERIDAVPGSMFYCTTDKAGNVWVRSSEGAHRIVTGHRPYSTVTTGENSQVRTSMIDSRHRMWLSESDALAVSVTDRDGNKKYLDRNGSLTPSFTKFGVPVYALAEGPDGTIWLGSKPDGAFRLTPADNGGYRVDHFDQGNVYDFHFDPKGAMWIAVMGRGLVYCPDPSALQPRFFPLNGKERYPDGARMIRHIAMAGDTMLLASTTAGLLVLDTRTVAADSLRASLLTSRPGVATSLGNIAVMDVTVASDGTILVATESDGVNIAVPAAIDRPDDWTFTHHNAESGLTDVALAIAETSMPGWYLVTSNKRIYLFNPSSGRKMVYGQWYWGDRLRFTDASPVVTADGRWLLGHDSGAVVVAADTVMHTTDVAPVLFTAASIEGAPELLLSARTDSIVLGKHDRNLTVKFAALDFSGSDDIEYSIKLDNDEWVNLGRQNSLTLLDLAPGEYILEVKATSAAGSILDRTDRITIIVTPTFWETTFAKILYAVAILLFAAGCVWIVAYIRAMKRKQREILNAYLSLVKSSGAGDPSAELSEGEDPAYATGDLPLTGEDKILMDAVTAFVTDHISDPEVTVEDLAQAVSLSRSSLNRKMKSIMGVSPAEFIRESRLSKAARLLTETDMSLKSIAYDCGFADFSYFGKCFKASRGVTPGAYRKSEVK